MVHGKGGDKATTKFSVMLSITTIFGDEQTKIHNSSHYQVLRALRLLECCDGFVCEWEGIGQAYKKSEE